MIQESWLKRVTQIQNNSCDKFYKGVPQMSIIGGIDIGREEMMSRRKWSVLVLGLGSEEGYEEAAS